MSWICSKCETSNSDEVKDCIVCDKERQKKPKKNTRIRKSNPNQNTSSLVESKSDKHNNDTVGCVIGCLIIIIMIYVVFLAFRYVAGFFKTTTPKPSIPINAPKLPEPSQIKVPKPKTATSTPKKIDEKTSKVVSKPTTPTTQSPKTKSKPTPEPTYYPVNIDGLTIRFVDCPAGKFRMGVKNEDFTERKSEGKTVEFSRNFWIMETEVTQELWRKFETNPHGWSVKTGYGFKYPAYSIDWNMANNFAKKFEESLRLSGQLSPDLEINLPTEAQWEYACRAGTTAEFPFGNDGTKLDENAWFKKNASGQLHEVGKKAPNNWGVYDMLGNVAEWCADAWEDEIPGGIDPLIEGDAGSYRVLKGGSWNSNADLCKTDFRAKNQSTEKSNSYGFRLVINSKRNKKHVPKPTTIINNPEPSLKIPTKPKAAVVYEGSTKQILLGKSKLVFKWCPAGEFKMGNPAEDIQSQSIEAKQVNVKITKGFWMLDTEVTQDLWQLVMGANNDLDERIGKGDNYPVYNVSLVKAKKFCLELTRLLRKQNDINISQTVLIPTEAQWEYACRAGSGSTYCFGNNENELVDFAWFNLNSERKVHPVAEKKPNAWGLYDMHGNLAEFTLDKFSFNLPGGTDPYLGGDEKKDFFVIRGGHFSDGASRLRSAFRYNSNLFKASEPSSKVGFRVVLVE
jgi:formylglycine-generating enzyme required for sulfatase activity